MAELNSEDVASASSGDGFARSTWCKYVELMHYSDHVDAVHKEGLLNDKSLPVWLHKVFIPRGTWYEEINTYWRIGP